MGWRSEHLRPRDAFMLASLGVLAALAAFVWVAGPAQDPARESAFVGTVGAIGTLAGYYLGSRQSERATERADAAQQASALLHGEVEKLRGQLGSVAAELAATVDLSAAVESIRPKEPGKP